jgi:restriction system protein
LEILNIFIVESRSQQKRQYLNKKYSLGACIMSYIIVVLVVAGFMGYYLFKTNQELGSLKKSTIDFISTNEEMKKTLLVGLYHRYKKSDDPEKENPLDFERFIAKIMSDLNHSQAYVTSSSGDYGVDIEETRGDGLYLGQVKCYADYNQVSFDPIAIIHSQLMKQNAKGGYVITTSTFSPNAKAYAEGLNIRLIEGREIVDLWVKSLEHKSATAKYIFKPTVV